MTGQSTASTEIGMLRPLPRLPMTAGAYLVVQRPSLGVQRPSLGVHRPAPGVHSRHGARSNVNVVVSC